MTYPVSPRTTPTRAPERVSYDVELVHAVLDEAILCHVAFVVDAEPCVLPQLHARLAQTLYLHGSTGARALRQAQHGGLAVCVTVTLVDGLVLAKSQFHHSINYRSVVVHGRATVVTDEAEKRAALTALVDGLVPGRTENSRAPNRRELAATTVLALPLTEVSVKVRTGPPNDDAEDLDLPYWAGVVPVSTVRGEPVGAG